MLCFEGTISKIYGRKRLYNCIDSVSIFLIFKGLHSGDMS